MRNNLTDTYNPIRTGDKEYLNMWWHSWEMWGRGRFRKIRKSKQKERRQRQSRFIEISDSKIYITADPVDLHPIFDNARAAKKAYSRLPQPPPASPTNNDLSEQQNLSPIRESEYYPDFDGINNPFKVHWIDNFIKDEQFLEDLVNFISTSPHYNKRENDMFTYRQIDDAIFMDNPLTKRLFTSMVKKVAPFMQEVVGHPLNFQKVSLSASKYVYTDHLLCHDDLVDDRQIAFIIYLNKKWERTWGGTLDLFCRYHLNDPGLITASLVPQFNRILFFEVSSHSFHQVSKILKPGAERISINGWFHYSKPITQPGICQIRSIYLNCDEEKSFNKRWIGPKYEKSKRNKFNVPSATNHLQSGKQNFIVFKPSRTRPGEQDITYPGTLQSYDEFSTWSTDKCIPLVREITFENAEELTEEGLPFLILFHGPDDKQSVEFYNNIVHKELYSESPSINFLTADGHKFAHPLHHLGKSLKDLPLIAIDSFRHMYLFPNFNDIKIPGKLKQFIQDLHSGKLHREFHFGPDSTSEDNSNDNQKITSPPESTFVKLAPSRNRYTLLMRDEL